MKTKIHTRYKLKDGTRIPGATTILNVLGKPALIHWAWDLGTKGIDYRKFRDEKAEIGSLTHYLILCHYKKEKPDLSDYTQNQTDKAENCLISFYEWEKQNPVESIIIEKPFVSEKYNYGGTPDLLCKMKRENVLIDFKTGKGIYPEMYIQLAAYKNLIEEQEVHKIDRCKIVRIGREENEGFEEQDTGDLEMEWEVFLNLLTVYNLQKEIKKKRR